MARATRSFGSIIHVHHRGDRGVDGILRLIELASHDGPLEVMLTAMCDEIAAIAGAEIASVYVKEDEQLVMRGNHGFPESAIGTTTLAVGEGITGLVAECMRPVSAAQAAAESVFKYVPGLGEERFPVFAGIPLISGGAVVGVLVMQRRKKPFAIDEVTLATALAAPITLAIERRRASAVRSARLSGTPHGGAVVLGRAGIVPTATAIGSVPFEAFLRESRTVKPPSGVSPPSSGLASGVSSAIPSAVPPPRAVPAPSVVSLPSDGVAPSAAPSDISAAFLRATTPSGDPVDDVEPPSTNLVREIDRLLVRLREDLSRALKKIGDSDDERIGASLDRFTLALCDQRLRERLIAAAVEPNGFRAVVKDYARAATKLGTTDNDERVSEIEELCALLGMTADARTSARPGTIWLADRVGAVIAMAAVARGASALVACDTASPTAIAIAKAAKLPLVTGVPGLFGWARPGDLLAVDGMSGTVLVHPAPTEIERLRREREAAE